jgi:hypothetical protein
MYHPGMAADPVTGGEKHTSRAVKDFLRNHSDLCLGAILVVAAIYSLSGYFTSVRFEREWISISVEPRRVWVTGLYQYTNRSVLPAVLTLGIPFPIDPTHPAPDWVVLAEATREGRAIQELPASGDINDLRLRLLFRPGESKWIRLEYQQQVHVSDGRYLLATTRAWRRPIAEADFALRLAAPLELAESNYQLRGPTPTRTGTSYSFRAENFFPRDDWEFAWREAHPAAPLPGGSP